MRDLPTSPRDAMTDQQIAAYVDAACAAHGIVLAADERERVIVQYARLSAIAAPVVDLPLAPDVEPAPVFRP
jgi:hypothetical protein